LRNFLTFVAVALITALTVALVAPPFIDWSAHRDIVARAIAGRIGAPVVISGPVTLRLFPTPYLEAADVAIGPLAAPWLKGPAMRFEFAFANLVSGKLRLDDVEFDHPQIRIGPALGAPSGGPIEFGRIRASHADLRIERAGASPIVLSDLNFDGSARSTRGPWRGGGDFSSGGGRAEYQFATAEFAGAALPLKADLTSGAAHAEFDGRLVLDGAPAIAGALTLTGETQAPDGGRWPWRIAGVLAGQGDAASMADADIRLGGEARALQAKGRLALTLGERSGLDAELNAKSLNLDALLRRDKEMSAPPSRAVRAFAALAGRALKRDAPLASFSLKLESQGAYLGARSLEAPVVTLSGAPGGAMRLALASGLPGHGRFSLDGALELGAAPIFRGRGEGEAGDFASLAAWAAEDDPALGERLATLAAALPAGPISAAADVELSPEGYAARNLTLQTGASHFDGGLVYRLPSAANPGRLYLDLATDTLDIDSAPNVEAGLDWLGDSDLDFRLTAGKLRVARVGLATVQSGSLSVRAHKDGQKFTLEKLSLADFGGATIEAEGESAPAGRWARVKLDAGRLGDFAALLARAAPGAPTRWLQSRAADLGSVKATFEARRDGPPLASPFSLDFLKADGAVAGSRFGLTLTRAPAPVDAIAVQATLDAPDAGALLRKLGAKLPTGAAGRAELSLSGTGQWDRGFQGKARLALAGAEFNWSGALDRQGEATGPLTLKSADLFPALAALGMGTAGTGAAAPADLTAELTASPAGAEFGRIAGALAGSQVSGGLKWTPPHDAVSLEQLAALAQSPDSAPVLAEPTPTITGALEFDHASMTGLLALALGRPTPARPGAAWSELKFGPALMKPPSVDVALKIGALDTPLGVGRSAAARLKMDRDRLALDDVALALNGGQASGRLNLRRDATLATASGALSLQGVALERPNAKGRFDLDMDFAGAGDAAASLVAGLAGAGRIKAVEAKIARLDPEALGRAFVKIEQSPTPMLEENKIEAAIGAELDKGALALTGQESALALSSGALRFGPVDLALPEGTASVSGAFALIDATLSLDEQLVHSKVGPFWSGPPPSVEISARGDAPARKVNAALLAAGLAAEAIARENDRIENFEADVRERAFFNRRRKAELFMTRRDAEIAEYQESQERRRLMDLYLAPYSEYAASHGVAVPTPPTRPAFTEAR
jgi:hypothetical protein